MTILENMSIILDCIQDIVNLCKGMKGDAGVRFKLIPVKQMKS